MMNRILAMHHGFIYSDPRLKPTMAYPVFDKGFIAWCIFIKWISENPLSEFCLCLRLRSVDVFKNDFTFIFSSWKPAFEIVVFRWIYSTQSSKLMIRNSLYNCKAFMLFHRFISSHLVSNVINFIDRCFIALAMGTAACIIFPRAEVATRRKSWCQSST